MLKEKLTQYIKDHPKDAEFFKEEKDYMIKHQLTERLLLEKEPDCRFMDAYIERCDKQSENLIRNETSSFLSQPLVYFYKHKNEFVYLESKWWEFVHVDAVSLELDDVFGTYDVMLGLYLQKKYEEKLRTFLKENLTGEKTNYDLIFNQQEGVWDLNFSLNAVDGFDENMTIGEAFQLIYRFLFQLMEGIEK
ncbi:branched-chain amino acid aminotransferase [Neobacillus mesonae]|uniref:branched-chain amino acid aminotransferase n=1 Tax=Neobacillus mesonae TaxID=1193713 RepID=UPI00203E3FEE|nr:branched-chain amino acid aminotransferase [Neobacillus mesonae]MCM3567672.1 branched-chain amino acid aminotransferase [Neobacillus mesonae]